MDANFVPKSPLAVHLGLSSIELRKTLAIASESNQHSFMLSSLTQAIAIVEEIKAELQMKVEKDKFESDMNENMKKVDPNIYDRPSQRIRFEALNPDYLTQNRLWG